MGRSVYGIMQSCISKTRALMRLLRRTGVVEKKETSLVKRWTFQRDANLVRNHSHNEPHPLQDAERAGRKVVHRSQCNYSQVSTSQVLLFLVLLATSPLLLEESKLLHYCPRPIITALPLSMGVSDIPIMPISSLSAYR
jgi:hypothetical protein